MQGGESEVQEVVGGTVDAVSGESRPVPVCPTAAPPEGL